MKTHLRVKIASLVAERRIIKREMRHWDYLKPDPNWGIMRRVPMWQSLNHHEIKLKSDERAALLAYGFLRGKSYKQLENLCYTEPNWAKVKANVKTFGEDQMQGNQRINAIILWADYEAWEAVGKAHTTADILDERKADRAIKRLNRRAAYRNRYVRAEPTDQAKLKAELKAKWESRNVQN